MEQISAAKKVSWAARLKWMPASVYVIGLVDFLVTKNWKTWSNFNLVVMALFYVNLFIENRMTPISPISLTHPPVDGRRKFQFTYLLGAGFVSLGAGFVANSYYHSGRMTAFFFL